MSDDPTKLPPSDDKPRDTPRSEPPAQWARKEEGTVAGAKASDEGRASFLDDDKMSLDSKLRGGGRDLASAEERDETRLCPACSTVSTFIDGKCNNCDFKIGGGGLDDVHNIRSAAIGTGEDPAQKTMLVIALAVIVLIILIVGVPKLFGNKSSTDDGTDAGRPVTDSPQASQTFAGTLNEVKDDDAFRANVFEAIESGNAGWKNEGTDAFVYRYTLSNRVISATSQIIVFQMFVGGEDAELAAEPPGNVAFNLGFAGFLDSLTSRPGVRASARLESTGGSETPGKYDVYTVYGYYYGLEHMGAIKPIIDALDNYYKDEGQYPHLLKKNLTNSGIKTEQGYYFLADGFGYLPIFKTDSGGNIVMGTGGGLDSLNPEQCQGYYLVMYARNKKSGLDVHNKDNEHHYQRKIAPFPYDAKEPVKNVILTPDGEPDGITCVIKDGILLDK